MDKKAKEAISNILKEAGISDEEEIFVDFSFTAITKDINYSKTISTLLLTKQLKQSTDAIIHSNSELANTEKEHSKKMRGLTWALIAVGILQAIGILIQAIEAFAK